MIQLHRDKGLFMPVSIYTYIDESDLTSLGKLIDNDQSCLDFRRGEFKDTPLMFACGFLKIDVVKLLLSKGADIYAVNIWQRNVLHEVIGNLLITPAVQRDTTEKLWVIAKLLLTREAQLISEGHNPAVCLLESKTNFGLSPLAAARFKSEVHVRLLKLIDEVKSEFETKSDLHLTDVEKQPDELSVTAGVVEKPDDSQLFAQPQTTTSRQWFAGFLHRRRIPSEEAAPLIPISTDGDKPKME